MSGHGPGIQRRPLLRGYIHLASALLMPAAFVHLLLSAGSASGYVGAAIFGTSLLLLFTTSAAYHLVPWVPSLHQVVRRLDHSMIFVAIAGIYTPFCLQVLSLPWGIPILAIVWTLAAAGITSRHLWRTSPRWFHVATYLALGWLAVVAATELAGGLPGRAIAVTVLAGLIYSAGALVYALKRPNPLPAVFGHHEVFHAAVTLATALIYGVVVTEILPR
jgi:hemolysin III